DISERAGLEQELRRRAADLTRASQGKDVFLLQLAHEVRNALQPIRNALHLVNSSELPEDGRQACALGEEEVRRLSRRMDDRLQVAQITPAVPKLERVNLAAVIAQTLSAALLSPRAGGRSLRVALPPEPLWLDADPALLEQVVRHLIENALRCTSPGGNIWLT